MKTKQLVSPSTDLPQVRSSSIPAPLQSGQADALDPTSVPVVRKATFSRFMNRGRWSIALWGERIGPLGRLGAALAVLGATIYGAGVMPGRAGLAEREQEIALLHERIVKQTDRPAPGVESSQDGLEQFYELIPPDSKVSDALRSIHRISAQHGLQMDQAEYRMATEGEGRLLRYEITFPIVGAYPQIRLFLREVSQELPFVAPDKINFEYREEQADRVRATIRLALYSRKDQ